METCNFFLRGEKGEREFGKEATVLATSSPSNKRHPPDFIRNELMRIIGSTPADGIMISISEDPQSLDIHSLDLCNIKAVKRTKDGLEVTFYDKLEAMRFYSELSQRQEQAREAQRLMQALSGVGGDIHDDPNDAGG